MISPQIDSQTLDLIQMAVREDLGDPAYGTRRGDQTVQASIPPELLGTGHIVARAAGVVSGTYLLPAILNEYRQDMGCKTLAGDGSRVNPRGVIAVVTGPVGVILSAERVLLNFLGRLSGVATLTSRYVDAAGNAPTPTGKPPLICDTRKTTPGFRGLEKYAVRCGGGTNHRMGLYDGVMLKDNHLVAWRERLGRNATLGELTARIRAEVPENLLVWLEVDSLDQLGEALPAGGADIILLDNMNVQLMKSAVAMRNKVGGKKPLLEASGGITLENVAAVAASGVERISIGALTHSAGALDLSMELQ